jgi:hypothetical protein
MAAARARPRFSLGTYQSPKSPNARPHTQVQTHQRWSAGRLPRMMSRITSATAHPAVTILMTSWSSASSGGGGEGRSARSRVSFTPPGYEVKQRPGRSARAGRLMPVIRDVLSPRARPADEGYR